MILVLHIYCYKNRTSKDKQKCIHHLKEDRNSYTTHWLKTSEHSRLNSRDGVVLVPPKLLTDDKTKQQQQSLITKYFPSRELSRVM